MLNLSVRIAAVLLVIFGLITIVSGALALFGSTDMGAVVPTVLWFNFLAGFAYIAAGIGVWRRDAWGLLLSGAIAVATACVFGAFLWHIWRGGAYEVRTVVAMTFRLAIWVGVCIVIRLDASRAMTRMGGPGQEH
jgi:hypothetical protein